MDADKDLLVKFPRTTHLLSDSDVTSRGDLLMTEKEVQAWTQSNVVVEEKVDGANIGISVTDKYEIRFQNRSHFVNSETQTQFKTLDKWVGDHPDLWEVLTPDRILFGEWLYAKHSIHYTRLPDELLVFDIYDKTKEAFFSRAKRDEILANTTLRTVPLVAEGRFNKEQLREMLSTPSQFYDGPVEGVYLRREEGDYLVERAKIVRGDFVQNMESGHWSKQSLVKNVILKEFYG